MKTSTMLIIGAVAVGGFLYWRSQQPPEGMARQLPPQQGAAVPQGGAKGEDVAVALFGFLGKAADAVTGYMKQKKSGTGDGAA